MRQLLNTMNDRLGRDWRARSDRSRAQLEKTTARLQPAQLARDVMQRRTQLEGTLKSLSSAATRQIEKWREKTDRLDRLRETLGYQATLERGYAVVWAGKDVVTTKAAAAEATALEIQFKDGRHKLLAGQKPKAAKPKPGPQPGLFDD